MHDPQMRQRLVEFEASRRTKQSEARDRTLWAILGRIHAAPTLRDWVTLESRGLHPLVLPSPRADGHGHGRVVMFLAAVGAGRRFSPPWAYIAVDWPSGRLVCLRQLPLSERPRDLPLSESDLCTEECCERIESSLLAGTAPPSPPAQLAEAYAVALEASLVPRGGEPTVSTPAQAQRRRREPNRNNPVPASTPARLPWDAPELRSLRPIHDLLNRVGDRDLLDHLARIARSRMNQRYTIAVVGERQRGKSTVVNLLLGTDLAPTGTTPTTQLPTRFIYGPRLEAVVRRGDGRAVHLDQAPQITSAITASPDQDAAVFLAVRTPSMWLGEHGIELIDLPGIEGAGGHAMAYTTDAIACCDAVLLVCSALMPLGLPEQALLEQACAMGAQTAVVLTRLDQVERSQRASIFQHVRGTLAALGFRCEVWAARPVEGSDHLAGAAGPEAMRAAIAGWAASRPRDEAMLVRLEGLMAQTVERLEQRIEAKQASPTDRQQRQRELDRERTQRRVEWLELGNQIRERQRRIGQWLEAEIDALEPAMLEDLGYDLSRARDAKEWWSRDLPYKLRKTMQAATARLTPSLQRKVDDDCRWLDARLTALTGSSLRLPPRELALRAAPDPPPPLHEMGDLLKARHLSRIGFSVVTATAFIVAGPLGAVAGAGGAVISERLLDRLQHQRTARAAEDLPDVVSRALDAAASCARDRVREVFDGLVAAAKEQEQDWMLSFEAAACASSSDSEQARADLEALLEEARAAWSPPIRGPRSASHG